jgi:hypothetical protein
VIENGPNKTDIVMVDPLKMFGAFMADSPDFKEVADDASCRLHKAIDELK